MFTFIRAARPSSARFGPPRPPHGLAQQARSGAEHEAGGLLARCGRSPDGAIHNRDPALCCQASGAGIGGSLLLSAASAWGNVLAIAGRRCLVLAGGFFEWRRSGVADKQPFAFAMGNHQIMPMAGLWEAWKNPENGEWLRSCTIITTEANELMAPIHDRMPVILGSADWGKGLGEEPANDNELKAMLKPSPPASACQQGGGKRQE
jgi:hypothetical protein